MRNLLVLSAVLMLSGCLGFGSGKTVFIPRPAPPPSLIQPCPDPVSIPERAISDQEIEVLWGRDRSAIRTCKSRHGGLVQWVVLDIE